MIYADELGKCYRKRNNFKIFKDPKSEMFAVYLVIPEMLWDADNNYLGDGDRLEAVFIGYVSDLDNAEYAFDMAEIELNSYV